MHLSSRISSCVPTASTKSAKRESVLERGRGFPKAFSAEQTDVIDCVSVIAMRMGLLHACLVPRLKMAPERDFEIFGGYDDRL